MRLRAARRRATTTHKGKVRGKLAADSAAGSSRAAEGSPAEAGPGEAQVARAAQQRRVEERPAPAVKFQAHRVRARDEAASNK
jgi:hypothetical protein